MTFVSGGKKALLGLEAILRIKPIHRIRGNNFVHQKRFPIRFFPILVPE